MNVTFTTAVSDTYILVSFAEGGEFDGGRFAAELMPQVADARRFIVFDFTALPRLDVKVLAHIEPLVAKVRALKRKFALCCSSPTVLAVLEVTGLTGPDAILFKNVDELKAHVQSYRAATPAAAIRQQAVKMSNSTPKKTAATSHGAIPGRLAPVFWGALGVLVLLSLMHIVLFIRSGEQAHTLKQLNARLMVLEKNLGQLGASVNSSEQESAILAELESAAIDTAGAHVAQVAMLAREYAQESPKLRIASRELMQAMTTFKTKNSRCPATLSQCDYKPSDPSINVLLAGGNRCSAIVSKRTIHGMQLTLTISTDN